MVPPINMLLGTGRLEAVGWYPASRFIVFIKPGISKWEGVQKSLN